MPVETTVTTESAHLQIRAQEASRGLLLCDAYVERDTVTAQLEAAAEAFADGSNFSSSVTEAARAGERAQAWI